MAATTPAEPVVKEDSLPDDKTSMMEEATPLELSESSSSSMGKEVSSSSSSSWWSKRGSFFRSSTRASQEQQTQGPQEQQTQEPQEQESQEQEPQEQEEQPTHTTAEMDELRKTMLEESVMGEVSLLLRRPARICIVFPRNPHQTTPELRLRRLGSKLVVDFIEPGTILDVHNPISKPFMEQDDGKEEGKLLQVADVVESINDLACTSETTPLDITQAWHNNETHQGLVCLTVATQSATTTPGLCQVVLFQQKEESSSSLSPKQSSFPDIGLQFVQRQGLLQIQSLGKENCLATSRSRSGTSNVVVEAGDFCVAMATTLCAAFQACDAQSLWQLQQERNCSTNDDKNTACLSLLTVRASDAQRRWNLVRRAAVAVGGGTLLGVGGVLMVTPLHPVGHAMTIGGVGVLGTEFEAPRRALQAARDKFTRKDAAASSANAAAPPPRQTPTEPSTESPTEPPLPEPPLSSE